MRLFIALLICTASFAQVLRIPGPGGASAAATPPSGFSAAGGTTTGGAGNTFTTTAISVSAGQSLIIAFSAHGTSVNLCGTITGVTATGGDTFTSLGGANFTGNACTSAWSMFSATANGSYVITLQGGAGSPTTFVYSILIFTKGSIT